jgi:hypothetical protein
MVQNASSLTILEPSGKTIQLVGQNRAERAVASSRVLEAVGFMSFSE